MATRSKAGLLWASLANERARVLELRARPADRVRPLFRAAPATAKATIAGGGGSARGAPPQARGGVQAVARDAPRQGVLPPPPRDRRRGVRPRALHRRLPAAPQHARGAHAAPAARDEPAPRAQAVAAAAHGDRHAAPRAAHPHPPCRSGAAHAHSPECVTESIVHHALRAHGVSREQVDGHLGKVGLSLGGVVASALGARAERRPRRRRRRGAPTRARPTRRRPQRRRGARGSRSASASAAQPASSGRRAHRRRCVTSSAPSATG